MIDYAAKQIDSHHFREALVQRIAAPRPDHEVEFEELEQLYIKMSAQELGLELACEAEPDPERDYKGEVRERPDIVIEAFIKCVGINQNKAWDQFLVENLLMPSLKAC